MFFRRDDPDELSQSVARLRRLIGSGATADRGSIGVRAGPDEALTDTIAVLDADHDEYDVVAVAEREPRHLGVRRARLDPGRRSTTAFAVTAVVSAVIAAGVTWVSRPSAEPVASPSAYAALGVATSAAMPSAVTSSTTPPTVVVSVVGKVVSPGLVTLPEGARVSDAIAACGGAQPDADLSTLNLAAKVADGEQIAVGVPGAAAAPAGTAAPGQPGAKIDLNSADVTALDGLPGIGPVLAQRIVDFRAKNGPFATVDDLGNVPGIGPAILSNIRDLVTV